MCNTLLQNNSNLQHTPSEYFKCATHGEKLSNVQHPATNFQMCNPLQETFKRAAHCRNNCRAEHRVKIRLRCTRWPEICLSLQRDFLYAVSGAPCDKSVDSVVCLWQSSSGKPLHSSSWLYVAMKMSSVLSLHQSIYNSEEDLLSAYVSAEYSYAGQYTTVSSCISWNG